RAADIEAILEASAEAQIGASLGYVDLADQVAVGRVAAHAVLLWIAPAHGAPNIAVDIDAHAVAVAGLEIVDKDLAVRELASFDVDVEYADVSRVVRAVAVTGVDDVELLLVGRKRESIGFHEVVDHG